MENKYAVDYHDNPCDDFDAIFGLSFGCRMHNPERNAGISNVDIGRVIAEIHAVKNVPLILQKEVMIATPDLGGWHAYTITSHEKDADKYLDIFEVMRQAFEYAKKKGHKKLLIVTHPDHIPHTERIAKKLSVWEDISFQFADTKGKVRYDIHSRHWHTQSAGKYRVWKIGALILDFLLMKR